MHLAAADHQCWNMPAEEQWGEVESGLGLRSLQTNGLSFLRYGRFISRSITHLFETVYENILRTTVGHLYAIS